MKTTIPIEIDTDRLDSFNDNRLATLWHVAQANPAGIDNQEAGVIAEHVGREIIRRWLSKTTPNLWNHQGCHYYWNILQKHGSWLPVNGDENNRQWQPNPSAIPNSSAGKEAA